jgi:hypothetical protein
MSSRSAKNGYFIDVARDERRVIPMIEANFSSTAEYAVGILLVLAMIVAFI